MRATINETTLTITWDELIKPRSVYVYTIFEAAGVAIEKYNEVPSVGYSGFAIDDDKYTHTSYVSIGDTNPVNKLTGEFSSSFCGNQTECEERLDVNNVTIWHVPCGRENRVNVNVSMGLHFHSYDGIFAFKNADGLKRWTFDVNSCNALKCTDIGLDCEPIYSPALDDNKRAINATIASCAADNVTATIDCINGNWLGMITKPIVVC